MEHGAKSKEPGVRIENSGEKLSKLNSSQLLPTVYTDYFCVVPNAYSLVPS
jgi:hypothetical protein